MEIENLTPSVFISSTVNEFYDLRAAIAYSLSSQGFQVNRSEDVEFEIQGNQPAIDECIANVKSSDYYILIIGGTRGSLYQDGVSVTRQEYREAKINFVKTGRPIMLLFLREKVKTALDVGKTDNIEDEEHLREFIKEIESQDIKGAPSFLKRFDSYDDIILSLTKSMNLGRNLSERIIRYSLLSEVLHNLTLFVASHKVVASPRHWMMSSLIDEIVMTPDDFGKNINITTTQLTRLGMALVGRINGNNIQTRCLEDAIDRGVFLVFNPVTGNLEESQLHNFLQQTISDIKWLRSIEPLPGDENWTTVILHAISDRNLSSPYLTIRGINIAFALSHYNQTENVFQDFIALSKVLLGTFEEIPNIIRRPVSPFGEEENKKLLEEKLSSTQIRELIQKDIHPFGSLYPTNYFGTTRKETVEKLADIYRKSTEKSGIDMSIITDKDDFFFRWADISVEKDGGVS